MYTKFHATYCRTARRKDATQIRNSFKEKVFLIKLRLWDFHKFSLHSI